MLTVNQTCYRQPYDDLATRHPGRLPAAGALAGGAARGTLVAPRDVGAGRGARLWTVRASRGAERRPPRLPRRFAARTATALVPARLSRIPGWPGFDHRGAGPHD